MKKENKECIACTIQERDEQVKQMPRHTCGIDGPNPDLTELRKEYKKPVEHTEQDEKYNAKIREIAGVLANDLYKGFVTGTKKQKEYIIQTCMHAARAMVAEMAKVFEDGFFSSLEDSLGLINQEHPAYVYYNELCVEKMQELGLIPSPENEQK